MSISVHPDTDGRALPGPSAAGAITSGHPSPKGVGAPRVSAQRRLPAGGLRRRSPAITELAQVDSTGKERLRVSRLAMDVVDSGLDLSKDPKFTEAVAHKVYYRPVYFRRESEP